MFDELTQYKKKGHFFFQEGSSMTTESKALPNLPGVYYILKLAQGRIELVYIGKSGMPHQKNQTLRQSLETRPDGTKWQIYLEQEMRKGAVDAFDIYWSVTFEGKHRDLPAYVEGVVLQRYFDTYGALPEWNHEM